MPGISAFKTSGEAHGNDRHGPLGTARDFDATKSGLEGRLPWPIRMVGAGPQFTPGPAPPGL